MDHTIPVNASIRRRSDLWQRLGSFWTAAFRQRAQAKTLMAAATQTAATGRQAARTASLAGRDTESRSVHYQPFSFQSERIILTGSQLYNDPDHPLVYALRHADAQQAYGVFRIPYFALPLQGVIPIVIQAKSRRLLCGTDFYIVRERWCLFRDDPRTLFPEHQFVIIFGRLIERPSWVSGLIGAHGLDSDRRLLEYLKRSPTPGAFRLALAEAGGLAITRTSGRLAHKYRLFDRMIYAFDHEVVRVDYPHTELTVGEVYPAQTIIGDGIQVYMAGERPAAWWRQVNWRRGLSLRPILPQFGHLNLIDTDTLAYVAGQDSGSVNGSKVHARIQLSPDYYAEEPYWEEVSRQETRTGQYLNWMLGLPEAYDSSGLTADSGIVTVDTTDVTCDHDIHYERTLAHVLADNAEANALNQKLKWPLEEPALGSITHTKLVNALDAFFVAVMGRSGYVVLLDFNSLNPARLRPLFSFLGRELPAGGTPIVFMHGPRLRQRTRLAGNTPDTESRFFSVAMSEVVYCPEGLVGEAQLVSVPVGDRSSTESQAAADALAAEHLATLVAAAEAGLVCNEPCDPIDDTGSLGCQEFSETIILDDESA